MKNRIVLVLLLISTLSTAYTQTQLTILGTSGKFYLDHTVAAKENWYSIGRLFNLPPHDIASYNNLNFDKPLDIGQLIHIPLTATNFDQKPVKTAGESLIPIFHLVQDKEWAFKISSIYNDVPVTSLEKWNKTKRDDIQPGTNLIIGFLKVKTDLSPLAIGISTNPAIGNIPGETAVKSDKPADALYIASANKTNNANTPAGSSPVAVKQVSQTTPPASPATNTALPVSNTSERINNYAITHSNGGFFSMEFVAAGKSASGQAGTFKSTSGRTENIMH
jgi:hypothetical protein